MGTHKPGHQTRFKSQPEELCKSRSTTKEERTKNIKKNHSEAGKKFVVSFSRGKADKILPADAKCHHVTSPDIKIEEQDLKALDHFMLLPSRHSKRLKFLLSIQAFIKEALEQAESIAHILTERAVQEKKEHISKKKVHNERFEQPIS